MHRLGRAVAIITSVLLVASLTLIVPGVVGLGSSPLLVLGLALGSVGLYAVRDRIGNIGLIGDVNVGAILRVSWVGSVIGTVLALLVLGASPGELQATGGLCGLAGMANYFLRPVYSLVYGAGRRLDSLRSGAGRN
ncbi:MAG: hypothetical protein ABEH64_05500 [Salinirussus sp.]